MYLTKVYTDKQFSNSVVAQGSYLLFLGYTNGQYGTTCLRYKDAQGNFYNMSSVAAQGIQISDQSNSFQATTVQGALQELATALGLVNGGLNQILGQVTEELQEIVGE